MSPTATSRNRKGGMSDRHKAALATGREQGRAIRAYLEALDSHRPKRGRKRTAASVERQLAAVEDRLDSAEPLQRVQLIQQRLDLQRELAAMGEGPNIAALEERFVKYAGDYSKSKGISYAAWRAAGVSADLLRRAGIGRS